MDSVLDESAYALTLVISVIALVAAQLGGTFVPLVFKSRRHGWFKASTVLAFVAPVVILYLLIAGVHQGRITMLESFSYEHPWEFTAQFYQGYSNVLTQEVYGGYLLVISGLLGALCTAIWLLRFRRECRYQARLTTSIGVGIASFVLGLGIVLREVPLVKAFSACGAWDQDEHIAYLARTLRGTSPLWVPIVSAWLILSFAVLFALWRDRKMAGPARLPNSAVVAGVLILAIGGGAFASNLGRAQDIIGSLPGLYAYLSDTSLESYYIPRGVELPRLRNVEKLCRSASIIVGNDRVEIEGNEIGTYDLVAKQEGGNPRLLEHLGNLKKNFHQLHPYQDFPGKLVVMGDADSPSGVIEKVLMTCYLGEYRNIQIASVSINTVSTAVFGEIRIPRFFEVPLVLIRDEEQGSLRIQSDETFGEFAKRVDKAAGSGTVKVLLPGDG